MDAGLRQQLNDTARAFVRAPVDYEFTKREQEVLRPFFTNYNRRVFFLQNLPANVASALFARYSRLKDPRGIRGAFLDGFVPLLMRTDIDDRPGAWKEVMAEYEQRGLTTLEQICRAETARQWDLDMFLKRAGDPEFWEQLSRSARIKEFLELWLDKFGHNSIARTGQLMFSVEDCSILAAKSLEWGRPGSGYIELSTRYVDFKGRPTYPIEDEFALIDPHLANLVGQNVGQGLALYQSLMGENVDGVFPTFLREQWGELVGEDGLKAGVLGESCDVLGNFLPCSVLTQVGVSISGEALPDLIKHLWLDDTPENDAIAELIIDEAVTVGASQFLNHMDVSEWRRSDWSYLAPQAMDHPVWHAPSPNYADAVLYDLFHRTERYQQCGGWANVINELCAQERSDFDKLPAQFEHITATLAYVMTMRGHRDLHRQGFCTHHRSLVTPLVGFYRYPKPAPPALQQGFDRIHQLNTDLWQLLAKLPEGQALPTMYQYAMAMGNLVNYSAGANLRQWEFCNWQRSKWAVNDEVRQQFLVAENFLRTWYWWWQRLSDVSTKARVDLTPHYVFARGKTPHALPVAS